MIQRFTINYFNLLSICQKLSIEDPERTKTDLDLLGQNIIQSNLPLFYQGIIPVEIDHQDIKVTLFGEPFPTSFVAVDIYGYATYDGKVIQHLLNAIAIAQSINGGHIIFTNMPSTSFSTTLSSV